jgi:hypothetical protein
MALVTLRVSGAYNGVDADVWLTFCVKIALAPHGYFLPQTAYESIGLRSTIDQNFFFIVGCDQHRHDAILVVPFRGCDNSVDRSHDSHLLKGLHVASVLTKKYRRQKGSILSMSNTYAKLEGREAGKTRRQVPVRAPLFSKIGHHMSVMSEVGSCQS